jgi:hypothetical protein
LELRDIGVPESVDALLGIPDDEHVLCIERAFLTGGQERDEIPLAGVCVLEFIHHHVLELLAQLLTNRFVFICL